MNDGYASSRCMICFLIYFIIHSLNGPLKKYLHVRVLIGWELECSISTMMVDTYHIVGIEKWIPITKVGKEYLVSTIIVDTYNIVDIDIDKEMSTCTTKIGKPTTMANIEKKLTKKWGVIAKVGKKYLVSTTMANT